MAYASNTLVQISSGPNGSLVFHHDAGSDTMATVLAAGYFDNADDDLNLTVDDLIFSQCADGDIWHKVGSITSDAVTTQLVSGEGPWNGDVSTAAQALSVGISEIGTGTATAFTAPTPYPGAKLTLHQSGSATVKTLGVSSSGVTFNAKGDTTITLTGSAGAQVSLLGVSASQWVPIAGSGYTLS